MKGTIASVLFVACLALLCSSTSGAPESTGRECPLFCPAIYSPVCSYDGTCYRQYGNQCMYDTAKCSGKSNLETVDFSLCDLAAKDNHPNYKMCSA